MTGARVSTGPSDAGSGVPLDPKAVVAVVDRLQRMRLDLQQASLQAQGDLEATRLVLAIARPLRVALEAFEAACDRGTPVTAPSPTRPAGAE